jgi:hypothetical protein
MYFCFNNYWLKFSMSTQLFEQHIIDLNFSFLDNKEMSGVLLTNDFENIYSGLASPDILFALETAKIKFKADAVYFRHFQDGRASVPQLYLFDYTHTKLTNEEKNKIHIQMWNGYQVPAYIIIEQSSISIFDSRKRPKEEKDSYAKEILTITGTTIKDFNAKDFDSGIFWDERNEKNDFLFEQSATRDLIRGLKEVFRSFLAESGLNRHVALKLLVQSLLIKYLEERDVKSASGYFAGTYFKKNFQCSDFCETIRKGKLLDLLDQLAKDFNGKIFEWNKDEEIEARKAIQQSEVQKLANYLDGDNKNNQYVIWRLYSFSHLPVEVISSVYEELLTDSKDIVYTPEMIVSTLVDECMPIKNPQKDFKIIDVSCGSGIFLVKTYKRIVQWWRYEQWKKTGKLIKPSLSVLKELLLKSIHGIDIEQDAIRLSIFSLALAVLDEVDLDPPTWEKLKFPDLSKNIITQDFFEFIMSKPKAYFNLVIGNPPFNPPKDESGVSPSNGDYFVRLKHFFCYQSEIKIPKNNVALHFLVQSFKLLKNKGLICLVQPSGPLIYHPGLGFRQKVFSNYNLLQVIDFTLLADKLWGRKNVATAAVFIEKTLPNNENVLHLIAKRTFSNSNKLFLEFDHYDFNKISKHQVIFDKNIWKANLLGGGRIIDLLERLQDIPTLGEYLSHKKNEGWVVGVGFKVIGEKNLADYITGKDYIPVEALTEHGIDYSQKETCNITYFDRPRKKEIYSPPNILIREIIGKERIPLVFNTNYLTFPIGIVSIHAPDQQKDELQRLYDYLNQLNELLRFYIIAISGRMMIGKATSINKNDLMRLPYSKEFSFSNAEEIVIKDVIDIQSGRINLNKKAIENQIQLFSDSFCKTLNSIYQKEKSFQLFKIIDAGKYYALHFEYSSEKLHPISENADDIEEYIEAVIPSRKENEESTYVQKIIKAYGQDSIILAKPKQLRYWLQSIALRDGDETFADYIKSRYSNA